MTDDTNIPAWVQLYLARRRPPPPERTRQRGRPRRLVPRTDKTTFSFTDGERREIEIWKSKLSVILHRQISFGETIGILAYICSERFEALSANDLDIESLEAFVGLMARGK